MPHNNNRDRFRHDDDATPSKLYPHCDDADELADSWRKAGLEAAGSGRTTTTEAGRSHTDLDGHVIRFGSPLRSM